MADASFSDVVRLFYAALGVGDAERLGGLVDEWFAEDAVLELPPSLPYGGSFVGATKLRRMFTAMASASTPVGPSDVTVTELVDGGRVVAALIAFDWYAPGVDAPLRSSAVEVWTFDRDRVAEIRAYYWDTAACAALATASPTT